MLKQGALKRMNMDQMNVVVVSPPGRKLENLLTMLESIDLLKRITTVDSCSEAVTGLDSTDPVTVLIDYRNPETQLDKAISELIMNSAVNHIVLLQARNAHKSHFTHFTTSEVVFDDLSIGVLRNLMKNIQLDCNY
jgi:hypothetical protein